MARDTTNILVFRRALFKLEDAEREYVVALSEVTEGECNAALARYHDAYYKCRAAEADAEAAWYNIVSAVGLPCKLFRWLSKLENGSLRAQAVIRFEKNRTLNPGCK